MNPESTVKTAPRLANTKTARAALIHRINRTHRISRTQNMTQNLTQNFARVKQILLTPTRILTL